jgi:hypothetical protein
MTIISILISVIAGPRGSLAAGIHAWAAGLACKLFLKKKYAGRPHNRHATTPLGGPSRCRAPGKEELGVWDLGANKYPQ